MRVLDFIYNCFLFFLSVNFIYYLKKNKRGKSNLSALRSLQLRSYTVGQATSIKQRVRNETAREPLKREYVVAHRLQIFFINKSKLA